MEIGDVVTVDGSKYVVARLDNGVHGRRVTDAELEEGADIGGRDVLYLGPTLVEGEVVATLVEQGNGFPASGAYVQTDDQLYRVLSAGSRIDTRGARGNSITARLEEADWDDCAEADVFPALVEVHPSIAVSGS